MNKNLFFLNTPEVIRITEAVTKWLAGAQGLSLSARGQMALADVISNAVEVKSKNGE